MGCCNSTENKDSSNSPKQPAKYSWDNRKQVDLSQFIINGAENTVVVKRPGSIDGQQFVIQNCKNSRIFLLDHIATVTVDDCEGCQIVIGPTNGSVFFRDCKECKCIVACQQFRTRDLTKMDFFLHCSTQPIIEASEHIRIGCYQLYYSGLAQSFKDASLSVFNNNWSNIYDFSGEANLRNWSLLPENLNTSDLLNLSYTNEDQASSEVGNGDAKLIQITPLVLDTTPSVVPLTRGTREKNFDESCLVVILHHENSSELAMKYLNKAKEEPNMDLIQTKEAPLSPDEAARIFGSSSTRLWEAAKKGPLIGFEFNGDDCVRVCAQIVSQLQTPERLLYSSPSSNVAIREIENFYNFCDMQMSG